MVIFVVQDVFEYVMCGIVANICGQFNGDTVSLDGVGFGRMITLSYSLRNLGVSYNLTVPLCATNFLLAKSQLRVNIIEPEQV